jgi:serine/threonine-protein phosphatase PP1 catalytic subunit
MAAHDLDQFIARIWTLKAKDPGAQVAITPADVSFLCESTTLLFASESALLELKAPITVVGDTHGQLHDTFRIFESVKPSESAFLFLGDYIDRGWNSIENLCLLLAYKIKYPNTFFMLRGNHACSNITRLYGFWDDCRRRWRGLGDEPWKLFGGVFNVLPVAGIIDGKIFCVHGGLSPHLETLDDIRNMERPQEVRDEGLICDLLWSDPDPDIEEWGPNERGTSVCFGSVQVRAFLVKFGFDLVCRAHQAVMDGYEFTLHPEASLITLFSAPNYCYEFDNKGAILCVDENLTCSFIQFEPRKYPLPDDVSDKPGTPPRGYGTYQPSPLASTLVTDQGQAVEGKADEPW